MSDPKTPDDAPPPGDPPLGRPGRTAPFSKPPASAFVVPYESIDDEVPAPASVIVRQSYANEVPPVVARPQKQPGEDDPTTRVAVIDDDDLADEGGDTQQQPAAIGGVPVVTDADLEDEEARTGKAPDGGPAVIVDGPSEAYAPKAADRCPFCLTFVGISNARTRGVRYCPMCGADWSTLDREVKAPTGAVIPLDDDALPPPGDDLEDHPTNEFTRLGPTQLGPTRPKPGEPGFVPPPAPPAPARRTANPWLMLLTGVSLGLAGTMTVAWVYSRRQPPNPTVVSAPPTPTRVSPPVVQTPQPVDPSNPDPDDPTPVKPAPEPTPSAPVAVKPDPEPEPAPVEPTPVEPVEPAPPVEAVSPDAVQAALIDTTSLLPPRALVDVQPRIDGDIVFLTGVVDGTETLSQVVAAVAAVQGVRAVDSRGVRPAWKHYTVVRGDSLSKIAQLYYGDTNAWPRIFRANQEVVKSPGALIPGMKLRIPMNPIP